MKLWPVKKTFNHPLLAPLLLFAAILAVYYPAMLSGIHPYDDPGIITRYSASLPLSQVVLPGNGYYYRPFVELSFWLDNLLWGMEAATMHLENFLLHAANSLLVFVLVRKVSGQDTAVFPLLPLLAALLFALHPVNVEAIAWIAGRTDPLLALFVLLSLVCWLRWIAVPRWQDMAAALLLSAAALLTKETALAFGVVAVLFVFVWPGAATRRQRIEATVLLALPVILLVVIALVFQSGTSGLSRFLSDTNLLAGQGVRDGLVAFGFYAKKLIVPFPLNFAIYQVRPVYALPGLLLFPLVWWLVRRHRLSGIFFVSALLFMLPAVLVAVKQVAWTPFAERYLYLPSAFVMMGLSVTISNWCFVWKRNLLIVASCLALVFTAISLQRTLLWGDKSAFFQDAVAKSPEFGSVYYTLGGICAQRGEINRASEAFLAAERLNQRDSMRYPIKAAIMGTKISKGELLEARTYFFQLFRKKQDAPADFLELLYKADNKRLVKLAGTQKNMLAEDLLETLDLLHQKQPDPFWLYQSGQMALITNDETKAADFFHRAYVAAPADAHYRGAALTYLRRFEQNK